MITAFAMQTFSHYVIMADYNINTQSYAKNCVNKAKPKIHCNGKCQMMKKLQQEEKKDQENPNRKGENKNEIILSTKSFYITVPNYNIHFIKKVYPTLKSPKETDRSFEVFHPPSRFIAA